MNGIRANGVPRKIFAARSDHTPKVRPFGPVFPTTRCPAASASGFLQTTLSKVPWNAEPFRFAFLRRGTSDKALAFLVNLTLKRPSYGSPVLGRVWVSRICLFAIV